ncbi:MAG: hypothetical protein HKN49_04605 [Gammaproteobacteria bacterium]|nr:hypothetical protein [Gammaproteobacteria bacterium]
MRLSPAAAAFALFGLFPGLALALALGDIELNSALNEPLDAEIEILAAGPEELTNLSARVAPRETFERYGLDRPDFLSGLDFAVGESNGRPVLLVRSRQPIAEPFVTFLVEAQWRRGRLLREYTVLLDPPVFMPQPESAPAPAPAAVVVPRSVTSQVTADTGRIERPAPRPAATGSWRPTASSPAGFSTDYGPVRRGETLWGIAQRLQSGSGLTMNQIMVAIYRANQGEFLGNINLMKEGSVLRIPDQATVAALAQPEALATAIAHNNAWQAGVPSQVPQVAVAQSTGSTAPARATDNPRLQLVEPDLTGGDSTAVGSGSGRADAATRAALERNEAELSRLADENNQLRQDLDEIRRLISLKDAELAELQRQVTAQPELAITPTDTTATDPVVSDPTPVVDPSIDPTATGTTAGTDTGVDTAGPGAATTDPGDTTAVTTDPVTAVDGPDTEPADQPVTTPVVTAPATAEPGLFDRIIDTAKGVFSSLWLWIGLGVLALAAFAAVFMRNRGAGDTDDFEALVAQADADTDQTAILGKITPAAAPAGEDVEFFEDSGTFRPVDFGQSPAEGETNEYPFEDTVGASAEIKLDQSDPMAEADFHLAYGLYDQAADLVGKAVQREPDRLDLRMKLLEIFFVWGNQDEFRNTAQGLRDTMPDQIAPEWDKIVIMGKQICPDDDLFAGEAGISSGADIDLEFDTSTPAALDFDTSETPGIEQTQSPPAASAEEGGLDIDFGDVAGGAAVAGAAAAGVGDVLADDDGDGLDFDLGLEMPEPEEEEETRPEPVDEIKDQIKARLSSTDSDETAEMDLSDLGVDLDLGSTSQVAQEVAPEESPDADQFDDVFAGSDSDATSEMPAPTAELTAGAKGLDIDIGDMFGSLDTEDEDETARDLAALEESMEQTTPPGGEPSSPEHFSAEIETLHGDALDVDIGGLEELDATRLIDDNEPTGSHTEDAFSASVFGDSDSADAQDQGDDFSASVFGEVDDDAGTDTPLSDETFSASVFGNPDDADAQTAGDDAFSASVFADLAENDNETKVIGPDDTPGDFSDVFGEPGNDEETVLSEMPAAEEHDGLATDIFGLNTTSQSAVDLDLGDAMEDDGGDKTTVKVATAELALPDGDDELSEVGTKLDLARAYMDMGDPDGARGILEEVLAEGDESQQADAREMLEGLS